MCKNIVICLDGTGNGIKDDISNVLKCFRSFEKSDRQRVYYSQGVGTLGEYKPWTRLSQWFQHGFLGKVFGLGIDRRVTEAYRFLVKHYRPGDKVYIFGYSRGAYAARVLAGLIYTIGVLKPDQENLIGSGYLAYLAEDSRGDEVFAELHEDTPAESFRRTMQPHASPVTFMGLFDTVGSVFVPSRTIRSLFPLSRIAHPCVYRNPVVEAVCHAVAVDERRALFPVSLWPKDQWHKVRKFAPDDRKQQVHEVWFRGSHGDIGGGGKRRNSARSQITFKWMVEKAGEAGVLIVNRTHKHVSGEVNYTSTTRHAYPKADPQAKVQESLKGLWWILEFLPSNMPKVISSRSERTSIHLPLGKQRILPKAAELYEG